MNNDDVLIQRVLDGDDTAFSDLVRKYQRSVHALVWRKIGDFHIAEDITQDTFLKAYQKLSTLKDPQRFSSWLYVIATNHCKAWLRKKRLWTQPLENASSAEPEKATYSGYIIEENKKVAVETQREVVQKLLEKLQESDRTVITLYYLGGMTYEEISEFLGVSIGAIKSRLHRARQRLKKEEPMIRETLGNFQITPNLTQSIMREVSRLTPTPSVSKPITTWAIAASTAVLITLMLGIGNQHLARFQKPYSLDAMSEMSVELVDTPVLLDFHLKMDSQNKLQNSNGLSKNRDNGEKPDKVHSSAAHVQEKDISANKQHWIQSDPIKGSEVISLLATPKGELYAFADRNIYKLETGGKVWQHIFDTTLLDTYYEDGEAVMKKWDNTLYLILSTDLFASNDDGKTWNLVYSWPRDLWYPMELVLTKQAFYLLFYLGNPLTNDLFRSEDSGKTWKVINGPIDRNIQSIVNIQNTLFARTNYALYRFRDDNWQRIELPVSVGYIRSVAVAEEKLYVLASASDDVLDTGKVSQGLEQGWWIYRSTDLGESWIDITPTHAWRVKGLPPHLKLVAVGETLLAMEHGMVRSTDSGKTWLPPQLLGTVPSMNANIANKDFAVAVNERIFYVSGRNGLHRSTDSGKSWSKINIAAGKSKIDTLIAYKGNGKKDNIPPTLYARYEGRIAKTPDGGKSWNVVQIEIPMTDPDREKPPDITHITESNGVLYAKGGGSFSRSKTYIYRVSTDANILVPVQGIPIFDSSKLYGKSDEIMRNQFNGPDKSLIEQLQEEIPGAKQFLNQLANTNQENKFKLFMHGSRSPFAVSGDTFYMEYNYKLFQWKLGDPEWSETGQEETTELTLDIAAKKPKIAALGNTIYVGKRDGHLVVSFNKGTNWIDLTPALPFQVNDYKEILFAGTTVYVATDAGIIASDDGRRWNTITNAARDNLIMEHLANDGNTVYGVKDTGVYRFENGIWQQVVSEIPNNVTSLAVDENTIYVGTQSSGMLRFILEY